MEWAPQNVANLCYPYLPYCSYHPYCPHHPYGRYHPYHSYTWYPCVTRAVRIPTPLALSVPPVIIPPVPQATRTTTHIPAPTTPRSQVPVLTDSCGLAGLAQFHPRSSVHLWFHEGIDLAGVGLRASSGYSSACTPYCLCVSGVALSASCHWQRFSWSLNRGSVCQEEMACGPKKN